MQKNVTEWLDRTAERFPDKAAIVDEWEMLSFREYRQKALAIAAELISSGVGPGAGGGLYGKEREGVGLFHGNCLQRELLFSN